MKSPLATREYFFPVVQVVAEPKFSAKNDLNAVNYKIGTDLSEGENKRTYQLTLEIESTHDTEKINAYRVHLVVVGFFEVSPKWPEPEKLILINGASILYSAAREYLLTITSRGPWGALMLPTVSFNGLSQENEAKEEEPKKKLPRKIAPKKKPPTK